MALEIKNISGVICLKGNVSTSQLEHLELYFETLLNEQDDINVNFCQINDGIEDLTSLLKTIENKLDENKTLNYYGIAKPEAIRRYFELNNARNFYHAA